MKKFTCSVVAFIFNPSNKEFNEEVILSTVHLFNPQIKRYQSLIKIPQFQIKISISNENLNFELKRLNFK